MTILHKQSLAQLCLFSSIATCDANTSAFVGSPRTASSSSLQLHRYRGNRRQSIQFNQRHTSLPSNRHSPLQMSLHEATTTTTDDAFTKAVESNNLQALISHLKSNPSSIPNLTNAQLTSIFDAIEVATAETDENTVNKRAIEDATLISATSSSSKGSNADVEFRSLDRVRSQMTQLYQLLREGGQLNVFGAIGRKPPSSSKFATPEGPIYPTMGSKIITPNLLEQITGMEMINLTPRPTNLLLYGGAALAVLEGILSLYLHINFNLLVFCTLLLALLDQVLVSGAVFETGLRMVLPEMKTRITKHEAGHFLCAYLLGCPVEGVVLSTWAALQDGRFGGRSTRAVSAGTSYYDLDLSEQISGMKPLTRESIDRYSIIVMGGIAAEAVEFGRADGGAGDEEALVRFLRSLNPRGGNAVKSWSPELIRNQARFGATEAVLLLKEYKPCYDALVDALERGGDLGNCIVAIENAAKKEGLGWLPKPFGMVLDEGEHGKWIPIEESDMMSSSNGNSLAMDGSNVDPTSTNGETNGVPTYGEDPITSTEHFLQKYREEMEQKLASIDQKLDELDRKSD